MIIGRFKNIYLKIFITVIIYMGLTITGSAQLVELNLRLQSDTILIGERTELHLEIVKRSQVSLRTFPLIDSLSKEVEILDSLITTSQDSLNLVLQLTSFTPGTYKISPIPLVFSYENNLDTIYSPETKLIVISPEINEQADIKDIKPPLNLPFRIREIIPQTGIVVLILAILFLIIFFIVRRLRNKKILEREEKALPPHLYAIRSLDRLKEEKLWQKGKTKEYYSRLADIMRVYLDKRFVIPAMEYVSSETMKEFRLTLPHEEMLYEMLEGILQTADMVKFAKEDPLPAINQGNLDNAYLFVGQTKIEEVTSLEEKIEDMGKMNDNDKVSMG